MLELLLMSDLKLLVRSASRGLLMLLRLLLLRLLLMLDGPLTVPTEFPLS
jgi:hypothetical protein